MNLLQTLRKIRACEGEAAAQLLLEMLVAQEVAAEREARLLLATLKTPNVGANQPARARGEP